MLIDRTLALASKALKSLLARFPLPSSAKRASARHVVATAVKTGYILAILLLVSGVVNTILEGSDPRFAGASILRTRSTQTAIEAIFNFILLALGTGGVYLMYRGGRERIRRSLGSTLIGAGVFLVTLALAMGFLLLEIKGV